MWGGANRCSRQQDSIGNAARQCSLRLGAACGVRPSVLSVGACAHVCRRLVGVGAWSPKGRATAKRPTATRHEPVAHSQERVSRQKRRGTWVCRMRLGGSPLAVRDVVGGLLVPVPCSSGATLCIKPPLMLECSGGVGEEEQGCLASCAALLVIRNIPCVRCATCGFLSSRVTCVTYGKSGPECTVHFESIELVGGKERHWGPGGMHACL